MKQHAAELAKQKILNLPLPENAEDKDNFYIKNRTPLTYTTVIALFHVLSNVQAESVEELTQLFTHLPLPLFMSNYFEKIKELIVYKDKSLTHEEFSQAVCNALKTAPSQALELFPQQRKLNAQIGKPLASALSNSKFRVES